VLVDTVSVASSVTLTGVDTSSSIVNLLVSWSWDVEASSNTGNITITLVLSNAFYYYIKIE